MKYILFDTNVYLALIFPLDIWKSIVEEPLEEVLNLVKNNKVKIVCPDAVFSEVNNKIDWITEKFNEEFSLIYDELKDNKGTFTKENMLYFRKIMEYKIHQETELSNKNRLYFIEGLILREIKENQKNQINTILQNCLELFNEINVRLVGEFANYNRKFQIDQLVYPKSKEEEPGFLAIFEEVNKSIKPENDAKIVSIFIHFLKENNKKGICVTHDFQHLLLNSIALESIFPEILILRPGYVKCFIE